MANTPASLVERAVEIQAPIQRVFAFVCDPRNDTVWCPKVQSVEQIDGDAPAPGARYAVLHRPVPLRPARRMDYRIVSWEPPRRIEWLEDDGHDVIAVTYLLEALEPVRTRFVQRDDAQLDVPRLLRPIMRRGIGRDIAKQLRLLAEHLAAKLS